MESNKQKKISVYLPIIISASLIVGIFIGVTLVRQNISSSGNVYLYPKTDKINSIIKYIEEEYVDTVSIENISENAIVSMLKNLDPHSVYIPAEELQAANEPLEGNFSGIGVQFNIQNDTVIIINTIPNGPSALLGIQPGDRIVKVNDTIVAGKKLESDAIVKKLKGPRGTKVKVGIKRNGNKNELVFEITRDKIPLYSVDVAYMTTAKTGYIKINQFSMTTADEFKEALVNLKSEGMENLILDLRNNGGGILDAAINIADQFLPKGSLIVYTQGKAKPRENYYASENGLFEKGKLVVLIDELSASASEILAGAVQDNDRGQIVGRRSFGKGLVQEQTKFSDGSGLRLTVARYYTPSGRCIQKPYKNGTDDYYLELSHRYAHGELENKDSIKLNDSLKYKTVSGRIVYGGGGIMPDIFIPYDTTFLSKYYSSARDLGLIYKFSFQYSDENRPRLKAFENVTELQQYLQKQQLLKSFERFAEKQGLKPDAKGLKVSGHIIETQLQAYIARNILDNKGYYPIIKEVDNTVNAAIELLEK